MGCDRENFNEVNEIPAELTPTVVEFEGGFALRAQNETVFLADGSARRFASPGSTLFVISSGTIVCESNSGWSVNYEGPNFFSLGFFQGEDGFSAFNANLTVEVDGVPKVLFAFVPQGSGCQEQSTEVTITSLTDDHISGSFTGSFFSLDSAANPNLPCSGFTYVGEYTASFSLAYEDCE